MSWKQTFGSVQWNIYHTFILYMSVPKYHIQNDVKRISVALQLNGNNLNKMGCKFHNAVVWRKFKQQYATIIMNYMLHFDGIQLFGLTNKVIAFWLKFFFLPTLFFVNEIFSLKFSVLYTRTVEMKWNKILVTYDNGAPSTQCCIFFGGGNCKF